MDAKSEWPELMGRPVEEAREQTCGESPEVVVHVVPEGSMVTMDFNEERVRLFVKDGKVVREPRRG
ncbi:serine protease inhibitor [Streptomyces sp. NPDC051567]|uniref:serine protease inhibitor n=1 Tax=Streptomyces sp. NPDC051567 TaxID=3365660 RepID=UPI0037B4A1E1